MTPMGPDAVLLVSNNSLVRDKYSDKFLSVFIENPAAAVLSTARDMAHRGRRILADPAASRRVHRPNPYCTVLLTREYGETDLFSLACLEHALLWEEKHHFTVKYDTATLREFQLVELRLAESALLAFDNRQCVGC